MDDWTQQEEANVARTEQEHSATISLWLDGFNLLVRGLDVLSGMKKVEAPQQIQAILFAQAINSLRCSYEAATRGYYSQAINLVRLATEDWMAIWYLRNFPDELPRFTNLSEDTPWFGAMLKKLEEERGASGGDIIRSGMKSLHKFAHVDRLGVRYLLDEETEPKTIRLGPYYNHKQFLRTASDTLVAILALNDALDMFHLLLGHEKRSASGWFGNRVREWQRTSVPADWAAQEERDRDG